MSTLSYATSATRVTPRHVALLRIVGLSAVCGVAWGLIVSPQARQVAAHHRSIEQTQQRIAAELDQAAGSPDPIMELERNSSAAKAIAEFGSRPNDAQTLYNSYRRLADECNVRVDRVEPRALDSVARHDTVRSVVYTIDVAGTYEGVSRMIHSIQTKMGPTRVRAFRMTPAAKPGAEATASHDWLVATIETVHIGIVLPEAIRNAATSTSTTAMAQEATP